MHAQPRGRRPNLLDQRLGCRPRSRCWAPRATAIRRRRPCPAARHNDSGRPAGASHTRRQSAPSRRKYLPSSLKMNSSPSKKTKSTPTLGGCLGQLVAQFHENGHAAAVVVGPHEAAAAIDRVVQRKGQRVVVAAEHDPLSILRIEAHDHVGHRHVVADHLLVGPVGRIGGLEPLELDLRPQLLEMFGRGTSAVRPSPPSRCAAARGRKAASSSRTPERR